MRHAVSCGSRDVRPQAASQGTTNLSLAEPQMPHQHCGAEKSDEKGANDDKTSYALCGSNTCCLLGVFGYFERSKSERRR